MNSRYERSRRTLYRSRKGKILGVCKGLSEYFGLSLKWTRIIAVLTLIFTGFWPAFAIYLAAAYFMSPEPIVPLESDLEEEFYNSYTASSAMALGRLKYQFDRLDRRIQRMESVVTAKEYNWEQRLNS
jgi:phage shock protein C